MRKRGIQRICIFLIYLMIILPLHTSVVFAQFYGEVHGSARIPGFRKAANDVTIINVSAKINQTPGPLTPSRFILLTDPTKRFTCSFNNISGYTDCETTIPEEKPGGQYLYEVQLFQADGLTPSFPKKTLKLLIDDLAPDILKFDIDRKENNITAIYTVADRLCPTCPPNTCSGFKKIEFYSNSQKIGEANGTTRCLMQNTTPISVPTYTTSTRNICLRAYDGVDQYSELCKDFLIDFSPPELVNASLWVKGAGDVLTPVKYFTGKPLGNVVLSIYLREDTALNESTLEADLGALNTRPEFKEVYKNIKASDGRFRINCANRGDDLYECKIENLLVFLDPQTQNTIINFAINDTAKNEFKQDITLPIAFDGSAPVVTKVRTALPDNQGRYWISPHVNNTIFVDVTETGSGLNRRRMFLDASALGTQTYYNPEGWTNVTGLQAFNCSEGWTCAFPNVIVADDVEIPSGEIVSINVLPFSSDDAGNLVTGADYGAMYFDSEAPQILDYVLPGICPIYGDTVEIEVTIDEKLSGGVKMSYDARTVSTSIYPKQAECEQNENRTWTCTMTIDNLWTVAKDDFINVTISDLAGNENKTQIPFTLCEAAEGVPPNLITCNDPSSIYNHDEGSGDYPKPEKLDRKIAAQIAMPVFVKPNCNAGDAEIQDVELTSCTMLEGGAITDPYVFDKETDILNPVIAGNIQLDQAWVSTEDFGKLPEKVWFSCELNYRVKYGNKLYTMPEQENVTFSMPLENLPLGYVEDEVFDNLDGIKDDIDDMGQTIKDLEGVNYFFGTICTIAELAVMLMQVIILLKQAMWLISLLVWWWGSVESANKFFGAVCKIATYVMYIVVSFIWNTPGYFSTLPTPGTIFRFVCSFYTCRLADASKWALFKRPGGPGSKETVQQGSYTYKWESEDGAYDWTEDGETSMEVNEDGDIIINSKEVGNADDTKVIRKIAPEDANPDERKHEIRAAMTTPSGFNLDPYHSINTAMTTACVPMIIYNLKKLRQLKCMKYRCIADRAAAGFDTSACDRQFDVRKCLYYEGAEWKILNMDWRSQNIWRIYTSQLFGELSVVGLSFAVKPMIQTAYGLPTSKTWRNNQKWAIVAYSILSTLVPWAFGSMAPQLKTFQKSFRCPFYDGMVNYKEGQQMTAKQKEDCSVVLFGLMCGDEKNEQYVVFNNGCIDPKKCKDVTCGAWTPAQAAIGIPADLLLAILYGMDLGEWVWYKESWDVKELYKDLEGKDFCEGIEDYVDESGTGSESETE